MLTLSPSWVLVAPQPCRMCLQGHSSLLWPGHMQNCAWCLGTGQLAQSSVPPSPGCEEAREEEEENLANLCRSISNTDQTDIFSLPDFVQFPAPPTAGSEPHAAVVGSQSTQCLRSAPCSQHPTPGCSCCPAQGEGMRRSVEARPYRIHLLLWDQLPLESHQHPLLRQAPAGAVTPQPPQ